MPFSGFYLLTISQSSFIMSPNFPQPALQKMCGFSWFFLNNIFFQIFLAAKFPVTSHEKITWILLGLSSPICPQPAILLPPQKIFDIYMDSFVRHRFSRHQPSKKLKKKKTYIFSGCLSPIFPATSPPKNISLKEKNIYFFLVVCRQFSQPPALQKI